MPVTNDARNRYYDNFSIDSNNSEEASITSEVSEEPEQQECPLCLEAFDATDKQFRPCKCGYQVCCWCWNNLMEKTDGRCPNCRREYDVENFDFTPPAPEEIEKEKKKQDTKKKKSQHLSRKQLANVRVIQRNLVYAVGLTLSVAKEDFLKSNENFGKYGVITKIVVNKSNLHNTAKLGGIRTPTVSAYITYSKPEEALAAIQAIDSTWLDGKLIRCSFGTTKYCAYFLRGIPCTNPDCMYLHDYGNNDDTFNKEEIVLRNGLPVPTKFPHLYPPPSGNIQKHTWNFANSQNPGPQQMPLQQAQQQQAQGTLMPPQSGGSPTMPYASYTANAYNNAYNIQYGHSLLQEHEDEEELEEEFDDLEELEEEPEPEHIHQDVVANVNNNNSASKLPATASWARRNDVEPPKATPKQDTSSEKKQQQEKKKKKEKKKDKKKQKQKSSAATTAAPVLLEPKPEEKTVPAATAAPVVTEKEPIIVAEPAKTVEKPIELQKQPQVVVDAAAKQPPQQQQFILLGNNNNNQNNNQNNTSTTTLGSKSLLSQLRNGDDDDIINSIMNTKDSQEDSGVVLQFQSLDIVPPKQVQTAPPVAQWSELLLNTANSTSNGNNNAAAADNRSRKTSRFQFAFEDELLNNQQQQHQLQPQQVHLESSQASQLLAQQQQQQQNAATQQLPPQSLLGQRQAQQQQQQQQHVPIQFSNQDLQQSFRALLPNVNINFTSSFADESLDDAQQELDQLGIWGSMQQYQQPQQQQPQQQPLHHHQPQQQPVFNVFNAFGFPNPMMAYSGFAPAPQPEYMDPYSEENLYASWTTNAPMNNNNAMNTPAPPQPQKMHHNAQMHYQYAAPFYAQQPQPQQASYGNFGWGKK